MNKMPVPQQQQPSQQMNPQPPAMSQYNTFENVVPNQMPGAQMTGAQMPGAQMPGTQMPGTQMPGTQMPGTQMPGTQMPGTQMPGADMPPNMFKMQRGRSKELS